MLVNEIISQNSVRKCRKYIILIVHKAHENIILVYYNIRLAKKRTKEKNHEGPFRQSGGDAKQVIF